MFSSISCTKENNFYSHGRKKLSNGKLMNFKKSLIGRMDPLIDILHKAKY